jgi:hypothetical protein
VIGEDTTVEEQDRELRTVDSELVENLEYEEALEWWCISVLFDAGSRSK